MQKVFLAAFAAATLASVGLNVAAAVAPSGMANAAPLCSPWNANTPPCAPPEGPPGTCDANGVCGQLWCPGSGMERIPQWDMNVCHTFYFDPAAPLTEPVIIQGQPPGPPPPPRPPCIPLINCLPGLSSP